MRLQGRLLVRAVWLACTYAGEHICIDNETRQQGDPAGERAAGCNAYGAARLLAVLKALPGYIDVVNLEEGVVVPDSRGASTKSLRLRCSLCDLRSRRPCEIQHPPAGPIER